MNRSNKHHQVLTTTPPAMLLSICPAMSLPIGYDANERYMLCMCPFYYFTVQLIAIHITIVPYCLVIYLWLTEHVICLAYNLDKKIWNCVKPSLPFYCFIFEQNTLRSVKTDLWMVTSNQTFNSETILPRKTPVQLLTSSEYHEGEVLKKKWWGLS